MVFLVLRLSMVRLAQLEHNSSSSLEMTDYIHSHKETTVRA
jgi:hypothetical protein